MSDSPVGVLVMAYGGPESLDDIEPYLLDVRGGRATRPELIEEIRERYRLIGGRSPILELTRSQAEALELALNQSGAEDRFRAYVGMRHWRPYIREAMERMAQGGIQQVVAIAMAPHYSRMSIGAYTRKVEEAQAELGTPLDVAFVESYHAHPLLLQALAERVQEAQQKFPADIRSDVPIIFTAHSLPERILEWDDPYPRQLLETAQGVAHLLGPVRWQFAYQSAGSTSDRWLGPDAGEVIQELADQGERNVLLAPVGFVSDHVEILYDIDIEFRQLAEALGVHLERTESLNSSPQFIAALADVVRQKAEGWTKDEGRKTKVGDK